MDDQTIWSKEYLRLATVDEVPDDSMVVVHTFYWEVCIVRWKGSFYAFNNNCPHGGGEIVQQARLSEPEVRCGAHGYRYDFRSGESTWPAGEERLEHYLVRQAGDYIEVQLDIVSIRLPGATVPAAPSG